MNIAMITAWKTQQRAFRKGANYHVCTLFSINTIRKSIP